MLMVYRISYQQTSPETGTFSCPLAINTTGILSWVIYWTNLIQLYFNCNSAKSSEQKQENFVYHNEFKKLFFCIWSRIWSMSCLAQPASACSKHMIETREVILDLKNLTTLDIYLTTRTELFHVLLHIYTSRTNA